jgi:hypothetical protein
MARQNEFWKIVVIVVFCAFIGGVILGFLIA